MVSRLVGLGLISVCALVAPAHSADRDTTPVPHDLGEAILGGPAFEARDVLGRSAALVSAAQGRAARLGVTGS